ncbi:MAG TPA: hypothetical protein VKD08_10090 [Ignavibacteriaceae bacterium]|nr:hypothetical protein [Ignavibacteriaceae bacterium]
MWQDYINILVSGWLISCAFIGMIRNEISMILASVILLVTGLWGAGKGNSRLDMILVFVGFVLFLFVSAGVVNEVIFLFSGVITLIISFWDLIVHPRPG